MTFGAWNIIKTYGHIISVSTEHRKQHLMRKSDSILYFNRSISKSMMWLSAKPGGITLVERERIRVLISTGSCTALRKYLGQSILAADKLLWCMHIPEEVIQYLSAAFHGLKLSVSVWNCAPFGLQHESSNTYNTFGNAIVRPVTLTRSVCFTSLACSA